MTRRGELNRVLTLQSEVRTATEGGASDKTFEDICKVWGKIKTRKLAPIVRGEAIEYPVIHEITIPWSPSYTATRRILYEGPESVMRTFSVQSWFNEDEANCFLIFETEEIQ